MGIERESKAVTCDLYGCKNTLALPSGDDLLRVVKDNHWTYWDGLFRCPEHPFKL